jgi:hypothetical protein
MITRANQLFEQIAQKHGLRLEWDTVSPVDSAAILPQQPGLDFRMWLNLQNRDEIGVQTDLFSAGWFPFKDPEKQTKFLTVVNGLISGEVRVVCCHGPIFTKPHKVILQEKVGDQWTKIYEYRRLHILVWPTKTKVVVNTRRNS